MNDVGAVVGKEEVDQLMGFNQINAYYVDSVFIWWKNILENKEKNKSNTKNKEIDPITV